MTKVCPNCGIDYKHIISKYRLGCSFCYFTFKSEMYYVFKEKQDNHYSHKGKIPKNYINPISMFINNEIDKKIPNDTVRQDLKEKINLSHFCGE